MLSPKRQNYKKLNFNKMKTKLNTQQILQIGINTFSNKS